ncbi:DUF2177 family protein [Arthrobacter sp. UKPF54-2]|uniref:DUF2177 family protein n=1 Tax=Arthrobacter sp. UKPF54-2 TaxID=2600159 RepID=UPI0011B189A5|nr:DUF2177 family protein [Arthrobacter sp. UKPF54-2]QDY89100.1 DUF2177 family protein [Arthrobacter sp. UKPF54-2]
MTGPRKKWLLAYAAAGIIFAGIDALWISTVANTQYRSQIGHLLPANFNVLGAVLFYVVYVAGIVHYGVRPNDRRATLRNRVGGAALFGFFTYATWALTAFAILKDFPALVALTDIAWGAAVCGAATALTTLLLRLRPRSRPTVAHGKQAD